MNVTHQKIESRKKKKSSSQSQSMPADVTVFKNARLLIFLFEQIKFDQENN
jgi:hypothetical protein